MQIGVEKNPELLSVARSMLYIGPDQQLALVYYRIEMKKYNQTVSDNSVKITDNMP